MFLRYGPEETNRGFDAQRRSNLKGESQPMATCDASRKHKCIKVTIHACSEYTNIRLKGTVFNLMIKGSLDEKLPSYEVLKMLKE